jgi:chaperonin GroEL
MSRGEAKNINHNASEKLLDGAREVYLAVSRVYGAVSSNVAIQKNYGNPTITHDGVSVAREIFLKDEDRDIGAGLLFQASDKSNSVSGDGTSATVMLGFHVMDGAHRRAVAGYNVMGLRRGIDRAAIDVKKELDKLTKEVKDSELAQVATISASDPAIGQLVADTVNQVGGVGITVEEYEGLSTIQEIVEGLYFDKGWTLPHFVTDSVTEEAVHMNPNILVVEKKIKQNQDIAPIIEMVFANCQEKTLIIIGNVDGQALETCALTNLKGGVKICVIRPPVYGDQELPFLEDVAAMTGGKLVSAQLPADQTTPDFLGQADKIIVAKDHTTILGGRGVKEDIDARISNIQAQLEDPKYTQFQRERMEFRLAKLQGKIGIIRVGGATESGVKETKFRVEDAIHATRAAREGGIVPGGGTTLARLSRMQVPKSITDPNERQGYQVVIEALAEPFKQLMENAGDDGGSRYRELIKTEAGQGYDVTKMTPESGPIDLLKAGIVDPVNVLKSVVENACEVAGLFVTIDTTITIDREYQLDQIALNKARMQQ